MKTYNQIITEAEGFQGKFTPSKDTKKQAIDVGKKVNPARQQPIPKGRALVKSSPNNSALKNVAKDLAVKGAKAAANKGIEMTKQKLLKPGNKNRFDNRQDEKQSGKGPDRAYGGGSYPKTQKPKVDPHKGGFVGGVKKSLGGDLIHKDADKRKEARFNKGKEMADGLKSSASKALSHGQGGGERFSGSGSGSGTNLKRGGGRGGD